MNAVIDDVRISRNTPRMDTRSRDQTPPHKSICNPDQPHISASQLRSYASCPLAWKLSRLYRPDHVPAALAFGSAFHAAAERLFQMRLEGKIATPGDLLDAYDLNWRESDASKDGKPPIPIHYSAKADAETLREMAGRMLEAFRAHVAANPGEVIAVEEPFSIELAPDLPHLKGRIDLVEIRENASGGKELHLCDFKTAARRLDADSIDREQLFLYALAMRRTGLVRQMNMPLVLRVDTITKTKIAEVIPVAISPDPSGEARMVAKARAIWKGMAAGICYPAASWRCSDCGYAARCAKWSDV